MDCHGLRPCNDGTLAMACGLNDGTLATAYGLATFVTARSEATWQSMLE